MYDQAGAPSPSPAATPLRSPAVTMRFRHLRSRSACFSFADAAPSPICPFEFELELDFALPPSTLPERHVSCSLRACALSSSNCENKFLSVEVEVQVVSFSTTDPPVYLLVLLYAWATWLMAAISAAPGAPASLVRDLLVALRPRQRARAARAQHPLALHAQVHGQHPHLGLQELSDLSDENEIVELCASASRRVWFW